LETRAIFYQEQSEIQAIVEEEGHCKLPEKHRKIFYSRTRQYFRIASCVRDRHTTLHNILAYSLKRNAACISRICEGESNENLKYLYVYKYKLLRFSFDSPPYVLKILICAIIVRLQNRQPTNSDSIPGKGKPFLSYPKRPYRAWSLPWLLQNGPW